MALWLGGREDMFGMFSHSERVTVMLSITNDLLHVHSCKTGSTYISGCVVYGRIAS